ncbi:amidohydrolase family protein [Nocardioides koreensis]|uniref:Amidohydrolase family protein n=1 Tax=Nocardioides koreensis TaxID=433651 RepID=A0ABN3A4D0_9ACTN
MHAIRASRAFDGELFRAGGATVLVEDGLVVGVEPADHPLPEGCPVTTYEGTLLPGLVDAHTHLVADSRMGALDRIAGYSEEEIDAVVTEALHDQLAAGVTTVRDLGDRGFCVVRRRDRQAAGGAGEPTIAASGPPLTSVGGHCHFMGGEVAGPEQIERAVAERVEHGVDVVKVMASGGVNTPGSDVLLSQFTTAELGLVVERAHAAGLPVTAHAHATIAVEQALAAGVDGIEHCSCTTAEGMGRVSEETLATLAASGTVVCPTLGTDPRVLDHPPPAIAAVIARMGTTPQGFVRDRAEFVARLHRAGVRIISGVDSGLNPGKRHGLLGLAVSELVTAGLGTAEAVTTATAGAADGIGLGSRKGRLAPGYDADLLVVDGDLESDVTALVRPVAVVLRGEPIAPVAGPPSARLPG